MKLEVEVVDNCLDITTSDGNHRVIIDIVSGEVQDVMVVDATIHTLASFLSKAKTRYNRFLNSKAIEDFVR